MKLDSTKKNNLLPYDGTAIYFDSFLEKKEGHHFFNRLLNSIQWQQDELFIYGKKIITKRKVAWYGDKAFDYTYSKSTKNALPWTDDLKNLKNVLEKASGHMFNACLLNLYHHGEEGMSWHSDDEESIVPESAIASISLGAERKFCFKHKNTNEKIDILLAHGSLLLMKGKTQKFWKHALPKTKKSDEPRINLTFRIMWDK